MQAVGRPTLADSGALVVADVAPGRGPDPALVGRFARELVAGVGRDADVMRISTLMSDND